MKVAIVNLLVAILFLGFWGTTTAKEKVTPETYIRAETDLHFAALQRRAEGEINQFFYVTEPTPLDKQPVVRMNRDTLYAAAIVDTEDGASITIPEFPDERYFSVYVVDNDHYASKVFYEPGTYEIPSDTKYAAVIQRIQLLDPFDQDDVALVNEMQKKFTINAASNDPFPEPKWELDSVLKLRAEYEKEFQTYDQYASDWMGARGKVDENSRHLAVAGAMFLFPEKDAVYINYTGPSKADKCYKATYEVPENDAFWSLAVYGKDGFIRSANNTINEHNVVHNQDGTFTVHFGSVEKCGDRPNRVDITEGWNFLLRVYRPGESVLERDYKLPEVEPTYVHERNQSGKIVVDERNFTIAETDRYMINHSQDHSVNTFRHSRSMSNVENQVVVRENRDVMYSHAVVDISEGATLVNPEWDIFSVIQVIDENQYTVATIYPGEQKKITPEDVTLGSHVFLNMRTAVRSFDEKGYSEAHEHQNKVIIDAASDRPYQAKGFETGSLDETRSRLKARMAEADEPESYFGAPHEVEPTQFLLASAAGIFGLPIKDAAYLNTIQPTGEAKKGAPSTITLPKPPIDPERGGFFSVSTYDSAGWIAMENYALNNNTAQANEDGSFTFHFNAPGKLNNLDVVEDWTLLIRLYAPTSKTAALEYIKRAENNLKVQLVN